MDQWGTTSEDREELTFEQSLGQESFVTSAVEEMLAAGAISILPKEKRPEVVSPLGVIPKGKEVKFRLIINTRYVNGYLVKKKIKFEGLKDLSLGCEGGPRSLLLSYLRVLSC